ncbi:MAG: hypothetical protein KGL58_00135 [Pseudomonadota bacterium]|nr:hypothetical protein [Pseudomonadota bacterium]
MNLPLSPAHIQDNPDGFFSLPSLRSCLALLSLGSLAGLIQGLVHIPLHIPGHQGLMLMAILMYARMNTPYRFAATFCTMGATLVTYLIGLHDPLAYFSFMMTGIALDLLFGLATRRPLIIALAGALAFLAHPLLQGFVMMTSPMFFKPLFFSIPYLLMTHLAFGYTGSLIGLGLTKTKRMNWD